jgi:hypothetical protein
MFPGLKTAIGLGIVGLISASVPNSASAITAELARTCQALTSKQYPPREPGNPAAGSTKGNGREQQSYFNKCIANNGKMAGPK